jgi:hypothetical protein
MTACTYTTALTLLAEGPYRALRELLVPRAPRELKVSRVYRVSRELKVTKVSKGQWVPRVLRV